jgi:transcription termination/antitermination protein NusG
MGEACPNEAKMTELPWYALKVRTRSEAVALASLDHYGFESYCPQVKTRRKYSDRLKTTLEPIFPGYLFCRFDLSSKSKVLASSAVEQVIGFGSQCIPVLPSEIDAIRRMVEEGGAAAPIPKAGDRVRVIAGALKNVEGVLVREARSNIFVVSIQLLQKSVSLSIDQSIVETI